MLELGLKSLVAYLLGAVLGSLVMGRLRGVDIREQGSGNAGGTNALRTQGWKFALGVVVIDVGKALVAVGLLPGLALPLVGIDPTVDREWLAAACATADDVPMGVVEVGKSEAKGTGGPAYGQLNYDEEMSEIRPREVQNFLSVTEKDGAGRPIYTVTMSTSVAVNDYADPTGGAAGGPMASTLLQGVLLASRRSCHGEGNWYLQEGDHQYRFSITSNAASWRSDLKPGIGANVPFFAVIKPETVGRGTGEPHGLPSYPEEMSFFKVSADNVIVSTVKKAEDDDSVVARFYSVQEVEADA